MRLKPRAEDGGNEMVTREYGLRRVKTARARARIAQPGQKSLYKVQHMVKTRRGLTHNVVIIIYINARRELVSALVDQQDPLRRVR